MIEGWRLKTFPLFSNINLLLPLSTATIFLSLHQEEDPPTNLLSTSCQDKLLPQVSGWWFQIYRPHQWSPLVRDFISSSATSPLYKWYTSMIKINKSKIIWHNVFFGMKGICALVGRIDQLHLHLNDQCPIYNRVDDNWKSAKSVTPSSQICLGGNSLLADQWWWW